MKNYIVLLCFLFCFLTSDAQSYHFSQFFSTPLLTNPATTGFLDGPYRLTSNFRSQAMKGGNPFLTGYLSADISPFKNNLLEGHKAGVGIYLMNDQAMSGALQTNSAGLSLAYNIGLDEDGQYSFGLGMQGVYHQRTLDYTKLSFGSQFGRDGYNPSLPIGEDLRYFKKSYFDVNAGILYNAYLEDRTFFAGLSVYNILRDKNNLWDKEFQMPIRYMVQAGSMFFTGESGKIYFSLTNMTQAKANETTIGAAYGIQLTEGDKNEIDFGMWYRLKDAMIPYIGYQKEGFQVGLSYDYTVSSLKTGAQVRNGCELTLIYSAPDRSELKRLIPWY